MVETVKTNFKEIYKPNFLCNLCQLHECNQSHLLYCDKLIGSNELVSYIPSYVEIHNDNEPEEQFFITKNNHGKLKKEKNTRRRVCLALTMCTCS